MDFDKDALFAELEITAYYYSLPNGKYSSNKARPDKPVHFKLNSQGGSPQLWNDKPFLDLSQGLSTTWTFFDLPNFFSKNIGRISV